MSWRDTLGSRARLARGAAPKSLAAVEAALGPLPPDLRALLRESNGLRWPDGEPLLWPASEIVEQNRSFRDPQALGAELGPAFGTLLAIGATAGFDVFAFHLSAPGLPIVRWDHETHEISAYADSLRDFLDRRFTEAEAGEEGEDAGEDAGTAVSLWVGSFGSPDAFEAYTEVGGSGLVAPDGLPLSRFHADAGLTLSDVLKASQHVVYDRTCESLATLLADLQGSHDFAEGAEREARRRGLGGVNGALALYRFRYEPRGAASGPLVFLGTFEID